MRRLSAMFCLLVLPLTVAAQFQLPRMPDIKLPVLEQPSSPRGDAVAQQSQLVRGYVAANKDVLLANAQMAEALGLKEQAAIAKATAEALTEGATRSSLDEANTAVNTSSAAVAAEMAKQPKLDAAAKQKFAGGVVNLISGTVKYRALSGPAKSFMTSMSGPQVLQTPALQSGLYVATNLPSGLSNLVSAASNVVAFARNNDIPVPADATKALAAL